MTEKKKADSGEPTLRAQMEAADADNAEKPAASDAKAAADEKGIANEKLAVGEKVMKGSFWLIAAIHITVFTAIGAATGRWRLLVIFLVGFVLTMAAYAGVKVWLARQTARNAKK